MKSLKVILSCGGTGGHIYPAIAIADEIKNQFPDAKILFIGAKEKMEMNIVPKFGYEIKGLDIRGFQRKSFLKNILLPFRIMSSMWQSYRIIKQFAPDFVFGTGGFASAPSIFVASLLKIPTFIHEQNVVPGLANRILAKHARKIFLGFPEASKFFSQSKIIISGTPLRKKINESSREHALKYFQLDPQKKCVLILGGSLGTKTINNAIINGLDLLIKNDIQLIWISGKLYFEETAQKIKDEYKESVKLFPYIDSIGMAYSASDVVVSRSGALSIAEIATARKPAIFIPSPNVTDDQQNKNIAPLVNSGAVIKVENDAAQNILCQQIVYLVNDLQKQRIMSEKISLWANDRNIAKNIIDEIMEVL